jgi:hypothetical protein
VASLVCSKEYSGLFEVVNFFSKGSQTRTVFSPVYTAGIKFSEPYPVIIIFITFFLESEDFYITNDSLRNFGDGYFLPFGDLDLLFPFYLPARLSYLFLYLSSSSMTYFAKVDISYTNFLILIP